MARLDIDVQVEEQEGADDTRKRREEKEEDVVKTKHFRDTFDGINIKEEQYMKLAHLIYIGHMQNQLLNIVVRHHS